MTVDLTLHDINVRMLTAVDGIREALSEYRERSVAWVAAERTYREAKSKALIDAEGRTAGERDARAFLATRDEWFKAHLAEVLRDSAKEALRGHQAVLSGLQSMASAHRAEAELAKFGPEAA